VLNNKYKERCKFILHKKNGISKTGGGGNRGGGVIKGGGSIAPLKMR